MTSLIVRDLYEVKYRPFKKLIMMRMSSQHSHKFKRLIPLLCALLVACSSSKTVEPVTHWGYALGVVADHAYNEKVILYRGKKVLFETGGWPVMGSFAPNIGQYYAWTLSKEVVFDNTPLPTTVELQWASFADRTLYRISLDLPENLNELMHETYTCDYRTKGKTVNFRTLSFGVTPGGYVEVNLFNACHVEYRYLTSGYATPIPMSESKRRKGLMPIEDLWKSYEKLYPNLYKEHPLPDRKEIHKYIKARHNYLGIYQ